MSISATEAADLEFAPAVIDAPNDVSAGASSTYKGVKVASVAREQRRKFIDSLWLISMLGVV